MPHTSHILHTVIYCIQSYITVPELMIACSNLRLRLLLLINVYLVFMSKHLILRLLVGSTLSASTQK